jgi:hypothetical protein
MYSTYFTVLVFSDYNIVNQYYCYSIFLKLNQSSHMSKRSSQVIFQCILTVTLFSFWAAFALLVVNKIFYKDLPGYTIGRICIWELIALIIAAIIAHLMIRKWGNIRIAHENDQSEIILNSKFGIYFLVYFILSGLIGIWQFWEFSQNF